MDLCALGACDIRYLVVVFTFTGEVRGGKWLSPFKVFALMPFSFHNVGAIGPQTNKGPLKQLQYLG